MTICLHCISTLELMMAGSQATYTGLLSIAVLTGSFLSGAMMCLSTTVIPVLLDTDADTAHLVRQWARIYHYGHIQMPALCVSTFGLYIYVAASKRSSKNEWYKYAVLALTTIAMVPFTWVFMAPTNNILFSMEALTYSSSAPPAELSFMQGLLIKWAWLHFTRTIFPLAGAIGGLALVIKDVHGSDFGLKAFGG